MGSKQYACLAHDKTCPSCRAAGQEIEWPEGRIQQAFLFDDMRSLIEYGLSGLCQSCQNATFKPE